MCMLEGGREYEVYLGLLLKVRFERMSAGIFSEKVVEVTGILLVTGFEAAGTSYFDCTADRETDT